MEIVVTLLLTDLLSKEFDELMSFFYTCFVPKESEEMELRISCKP
jgi:hypothetical protein